MGEEVLAGTFSLNEHPVIILFDSGASHDFISSTCAKKAMLSIVTTEALYVISIPGRPGGCGSNFPQSPTQVGRESVKYRPHYTEGSRTRFHIRDELDQAA
jgi:hypothetical protein